MGEEIIEGGTGGTDAGSDVLDTSVDGSLGIVGLLAGTDPVTLYQPRIDKKATLNLIVLSNKSGASANVTLFLDQTEEGYTVDNRILDTIAVPANDYVSVDLRGLKIRGPFTRIGAQAGSANAISVSILGMEERR